MRLAIRQCRYCILPKNTCEHRHKMRAAITPIAFKATVTHNCPKYYNTIPIGSHVEIELKEIELHEDPEHQEAPYGEWVSAGMATGTVIASSKWNTGFFVVRLDKPINLVIPERDQAWHTATEQQVTIRMKRGKDIKILHRATPKETEVFQEKECESIEEALPW